MTEILNVMLSTFTKRRNVNVGLILRERCSNVHVRAEWTRKRCDENVSYVISLSERKSNVYHYVYNAAVLAGPGFVIPF